tara:strand:+ start:2426 stop:2890 length:465 start_codon:yes stop_codon:yes gene_type:complete
MEKEIPQREPIPQIEISTEKDVDWKSDNIEKLADALSKAQSEMKGAQKKSTNPFFKSSYADLHTCIEASFPYLTKHGLSVIQGNDVDERGSFYVTTMLLHSSGQWIKSKLKMPISKPDAQGVGATITYARRFALSAMVGISQYDDDGESITNHK